MTCQVVRAFGARLGHLVLGKNSKTTGRQGAFGAFGLFGGYSLEGYVRTGATRSLPILTLGVERMPQIPQTPQLPRAVLRFGEPKLSPNRPQTGPKWGWSRCQK